MEREIKFRSKDIEGIWRYGFGPVKASRKWQLYYHDKDGTGAYVIANTTIGQYTGLKDRNGTEAYEHDIMQYKGETGVITYYPGRAQFLLKVAGRAPLTLHNLKGIIIGNIHDNPEIMKAI